MAHDDDAADDDDTMDSVGSTHQGCVKDSRYIADHFDAQEYGQEEDVADIPDVEGGQKTLNVRQKDHIRRLNICFEKATKVGNLS